MTTQKNDHQAEALSGHSVRSLRDLTAFPAAIFTAAAFPAAVFDMRVSQRRGLTLTEILAAVFVLSFGLVAALTVLPFASFQLNRMNVADVSGACGRGAIQQIRMAEWQKPEALNIALGINEVPADPYIVDPLGLINPDGSIAMDKAFPPEPETGLSVTGLFAFSLRDIANSDAANLYFRWGDDLLFDVSDSSQRPIKVASAVTSAGDFTWLYMVAPIIDPQADVTRLPSSIATTFPYAVLGYDVAAVVFHRRDTVSDSDHAPIRRVTLDNANSTINATGAYIEISSTNPDDLDLSSIKWILITGPGLENVPGNPVPLNAQWYRITGYDDIMPNGSGYSHRVFLVGPDWKGAKNAAGNPDGAVHAILCDGVVNVFQATMPK